MVCLLLLQVISPNCNKFHPFLALLSKQLVAYIYIYIYVWNVNSISKNESPKIKCHDADYGTEYVQPNTLYMFSLKFDRKFSKQLLNLLRSFCHICSSRSLHPVVTCFQLNKICFHHLVVPLLLLIRDLFEISEFLVV